MCGAPELLLAFGGRTFRFKKSDLVLQNSYRDTKIRFAAPFNVNCAQIFSEGNSQVGRNWKFYFTKISQKLKVKLKKFLQVNFQTIKTF
jgi:hypothetical protein